MTDRSRMTPARLIMACASSHRDLAKRAGAELSALLEGRDEGTAALEELAAVYAARRSRSRGAAEAAEQAERRRARAVQALEDVARLQESARVAALPTVAELREELQEEPAVYDLPQLDRLRGEP